MLKSGDKVQIYRKVKAVYWTDYMDQFVGKTGLIVENGYNDPLSLTIDVGASLPFIFPRSALKKVG